MLSILTILKSAADFFRKNQLAAVLVLLMASGFATAFALQSNQEGRRNFTVCLSNDPVPANCTMPMSVSLLKTAGKLRSTSDYLMTSRAAFDLKFSKDERLLGDGDREHYSKVMIRFESESFAELYERFAKPGSIESNFDFPIHREVGSLLAIKDTNPGQPGEEFLIPADGDKSIFIQCAKPFVAIAGNLVTNLGCRVTTQLQPFVFVHYLIHLKHLQEWRAINAHVMDEIRSAMQITMPINKG